MKQWIVTVGKRKIELIDKDGTADSVEICTRALEHLHEQRVDYAVGPLIEVRSGDEIRHERSVVILANAGKYYESAELQRRIVASCTGTSSASE